MKWITASLILAAALSACGGGTQAAPEAAAVSDKEYATQVCEAVEIHQNDVAERIANEHLYGTTLWQALNNMLHTTLGESIRNPYAPQGQELYDIFRQICYDYDAVPSSTAKRP